MLWTVIGINVAIFSATVTGFLSEDDYYRMPKIYSYDDYDSCLNAHQTNDTLYCVTRSVIKPNSVSSLWQFIQNYTNDTKRHFRHDHLDRGFCVERCQQLLLSLDNETAEELFVEKFNIPFEYIIKADAFTNTIDFQKRYGRLINICQNYALRARYNLTAYTEIEYCIRSPAAFESRADALDIAFLAISVVIVILVTASTWYDQHCNRLQTNDHYKRDMSSQKMMILTSFSITRNWYRLVSNSKIQLNEDLKFLQAIRFFTFCLVVFGHSACFFSATSIENTYTREKAYYSPLGHITINGSIIVQTFFMMSGTLLSIHFCASQAKFKRNSWIVVFAAGIYRYIRLTPSYAYILMLHATWLSKLQDGPLWARGTEVERYFCRKNWWTNLLYINNYVNADEPCVQQAWYLATEYQLFVLGMLVLVPVTKHKKLAPYILSLLLVIGFLLPALLIYVERFEGVFLQTLQAERFIFWFDSMYQQIYIPFHTNMIPYTAGLIVGYIYYKHRTASSKGNRSGLFQFIWYMGVPFGFFTVAISMIFYSYDFEKPSWWIALFFPLQRFTWSLISAIILYGIIYNYNRFIKSILHFPLFVPLGRLAYCAYISHFFVLKNLFYSTRGVYYFSSVALFSKIVSGIVASYMMGAILSLTLEFPISALQKHLLSKKLDKISKPVQPVEDNNGTALSS